MYVYLSKKIAIPNNIRLNCISWNQKEGYIAIGGEDGLLKVLCLDENGSAQNGGSAKNRNFMSANNLSMNQTLEGHTSQVQVVNWNEKFQKLTSSDQNGVIIVWMLYKGSWYEEMINNRNKSVVKGMAWSADGQKICIVYEDGAVIVGAVDGNRLWGKDIKNSSLCRVQWSPDGKLLLFAVKTGDILLYDNQGTFLTKLESPKFILGHSMEEAAGQEIVAMHWYDGKCGYVSLDCPSLLVCYQNGKVQLMRDTTDDNPIVVDTGINAVWSSWNSYGSMFVVAGFLKANELGNAASAVEPKNTSNALQFYDAFGKKLKTLRVPGREITCCSWEGGSLRISLSVDSNVYFANIYPSYKWTYFSKTVVFTNEKVARDGVCVYFWNTSTNACCTKNLKSLISIASHGEHCALASHNDSVNDSEDYVLRVCNAIATSVDTKFLDLEPLCLSMWGNVVVAASKNQFLVWNFRAPKSPSLNSARGQQRSTIYHVDDTPTGVTEIIRDLDKDANSVFNQFQANHVKSTLDSIACVCVSEKVILVARDSGMIQRYSLPQVTLTHRYKSGRATTSIFHPLQLAINCDSTRASVIDSLGTLSMVDLSGEKSAENEGVEKFERKDVWAMHWADDNPMLLVTLEKTRMYVFRGLDPEEPISCSGYICSFCDLEIRCVTLHSLIQKPSGLNSDLIVDLEIKSLRDTKELLKKVGLKEANNFIQDNPHPRLWRLLAESALNELDLEVAENAMVRCMDYLGIRFVKRLRNLHNDRLKKAQVAAFLGKYDEAERMFLDMDRRDLAIALRQKLGDYFRVLQLMKTGIGSMSDKQAEQIHEKIGDFFAERQNWQAAKEYYLKARSCSEKLIGCYCKLEEYQELAAMLSQLPDESPALKKVAKLLATVGMCDEAVSAYIKYGDVKQAVATCVRLNQWDRALELAKTHKMAQIGDLLSKYAHHLLLNDRRLEAVELYRKANRPIEAAKLLMRLAKEQSCNKANPQRIKKLYVLAALLVEEHLKNIPVAKGGRSNVVMGLSMEDEADKSVIEKIWRGAEAFHFLMLAQRQMYAGNFEAAMKTSLRLRDYEEFLQKEDVNVLLALSSGINRTFTVCSKAFIELEALESISDAKRGEYEQLAVDIFTKHPPSDSKHGNKEECVSCESLIPNYCTSCPTCFTKFPPCVISGRPIMDLNGAWICTVCKHYATSEKDVININSCPLCHSVVTYM